MGVATAARFEFHVSRRARDRCGFGDELFSTTGNVVLADPRASREFAARLNRHRPAERTVSAVELYAMGLIDEALHLAVARYRAHKDQAAMTSALAWMAERRGAEAVEGTLAAFAEEFPVVPVYRGRLTAQAWLAGHEGGTPRRATALEEMLLLRLANLNPAFAPFRELFDDSALARRTDYEALSRLWPEYFAGRPRFGAPPENFFDFLRAPALAAPDSLAGQLAFIRDHWADFLGPSWRRLLLALDALREEEVARWRRDHRPGADAAAGEAAAAGGFARDAEEPERFSRDVDWMPRVVMMAKNAYVWLAQLGRQYGGEITRLDQIPDQELDQLARRGFTALWLIGVWERSPASRRIKQLCGNAGAEASAYSLYDYRVAGDLGGEAALEALRGRAAARGLRLASDMVANHMGLDSPWVVEHPEWFLSLPESPYPAYRFEGPDLSSDGRVEIKIEDHYYDRSDAAVVFRRRDRGTGETRYVYHGNDGTSFPWNDSAQLNYLSPGARERVLETIVAVARRFPIIRFDAAMTLAKRHYQRLWFPAPGDAGAIPSRAEHGMSRAEFDAAMPAEFWREVVDRVAAEAPDTLLLAEAFWLMEGYFVRTLGMHRVYNSAFMHMLRDEHNANYRAVLKNTLEFDPDILKRYVNFMNNPDERTAVEQFGKEDKYFGVCALLATLPGLPMFGHGQIEGYAEKYGMDFRRPRLTERPDAGLEARHEREISPLLRRRALFAEAEEFLLYDFVSDGGEVNEDVFAYSNRRGEERGLMVYNNRYARAAGRIRMSCAYAEKRGGEKRTRRRSLAESFGYGPGQWIACRDQRRGREYLLRGDKFAGPGLWFQLEGYEYRALLDWRAWGEDGRSWARLHEHLGGRGAPSLEAALRELELQPLHAALAALLAPDLVRGWDGAPGRAGSKGRRAAGAAAATRAADAAWLERAKALLGAARDFAATPEGAAAGLGAALLEPRGGAALPGGRREEALAAFARRLRGARRLPALAPGLPAAAAAAGGELMAWSAARLVADAFPNVAPEILFDALRLRAPLAAAMAALGGEAAKEGDERWRAAARVRAALIHSLPPPRPARRPAAAGKPGAAKRAEKRATEKPAATLDAVAAWLRDPDVAWLVGLHGHDGVEYFVQEPFEQLAWFLALPPLLELAAAPRWAPARARAIAARVEALAQAAAAAGYRADPTE